MSMAALRAAFSTPRTWRRPSACAFAFERLLRVAADAALHAIVRIAAQPVLVALVIRIGRDMRQGQAKWSRLRSRGRHHGRGDYGWAMRHSVVVNRVVRRVLVMGVVMHGWLLGLRMSRERT